MNLDDKNEWRSAYIEQLDKDERVFARKESTELCSSDVQYNQTNHECLSDNSHNDNVKYIRSTSDWTMIETGVDEHISDILLFFACYDLY